MGRYYSGDIDGKFWFGIQNSDAADRFGVRGTEPNYLEYFYTLDDLEDVQEELKNIENTLGKYLPLLKEWYESETLEETDLKKYLKVYDESKIEKLISEYADYILGKKIETSILENGQCAFTAEL